MRLVLWILLVVTGSAELVALGLGPRAGLGTLLAGLVAGAGFGWLAVRARGLARVAGAGVTPGIAPVALRTMAASGLRWLATAALLWLILARCGALPVLVGLGGVLAAIWLHALFDLWRAERQPTRGAEP